MKAFLIGLLMMVMSNAAMALEFNVLVRTGYWVATVATDEFTGNKACSLMQIHEKYETALSIHANREIVSNDGELASSAFGVLGNIFTTNIVSPEDLQVVIDGERVDMSDWEGFIQKAKAGNRMTYRYTENVTEKTKTEKVSLSGFTKAWDKASAECPASDFEPEEVYEVQASAE